MNYHIFSKTSIISFSPRELSDCSSNTCSTAKELIPKVTFHESINSWELRNFQYPFLVRENTIDYQLLLNAFPPSGFSIVKRTPILLMVRCPTPFPRAYNQ